MGYRPKPEKLIRYFERRPPLLNGNFGTFLLSPAAYFKKRGFGVKLSARRSRFDETMKNSDAGIMFYYWRRKFRFGAHFVALRYRDGKFTGYNTYRNSVGPDDYGTSLEAYLKKRKVFGTLLISIRDKRRRA